MANDKVPVPAQVLTVDKLEIWRGERCLVSDLSFHAVPGSIIQLKGPNGSGKTSVLRCLAGLSLHDSGTIEWFGRRYEGRVGPAARARFCFIGHQEALKGGLDVRENLRSLNALQGYPDHGVEDALGEAGLASRFGIPAQQLSAGQRRRAALARLRCVSADAWLLDEPFTSLDVEGIALAAEWVAAQVAQGGVVVLSTHQPLPDALRAQVIELGAA